MVECKYKYQNKEKFNGKPYCACLNKLCEDIAFVCDENCQVYEDYKQLQDKKQEGEELKKALKSMKEIIDGSITDNKCLCKYANRQLDDIDKLQLCIRSSVTEWQKHKNALNEIKEIAKNDCENCCECTTEFNIKDSCSIYEIQEIINRAADINVLHKAKDGE